MKNSLLLYQNKLKSKKYLSIKNSINYVDIYKKALNFNSVMESYIEHNDIKFIIIEFDNCDASLDIKELANLKNKYNLYYIFVFLNHFNSFEYIDRYYAQLADIVVVDDTPYIVDFYELLSYKTYSIQGSFSNKNIDTKNIFASNLNNLTTIKKDNEFLIQKIDFCNIVEILKKTEPIDNKILLDKKFLIIQNLYKIYWIIYDFKKNKNKIKLLKLIKFNNLKKIYIIYKIFLQFYKQTNIDDAHNVLNNALYKEDDKLWK